MGLQRGKRSHGDKANVWAFFNPKETLISALAESLPVYHTTLLCKVCDAISLPGTGPLSKFFQAVGRKVRDFP